MNQQTPETLIIGAGLTGLSTAYYLKKSGIPFVVLERSAQPGGVIETRTENGFIYELGPNTGVIGSPEIAELFEELNGKCQLEIANPVAQKRFILKGGRWKPLPTGLVSGITTPLFTVRDKLRLLLEPFRKRGANPHESLSQLVIRRMGKSFLDYAVEPFIAGVYAGDPGRLVTKFALPKLYNLEQKYGSFIIGAIHKQFEKKSAADKKVSRKVFSVKGGLTNLVNALYESAGAENFIFNVSGLKVDVLKREQVLQPSTGFRGDDLIKNSSLQPFYYRVEYDVNGKKETSIFKNVVFTGSSFEIANIFTFLDPDDLACFTNLNYANIIEVALGFKDWQGINLDGFGGLIPSKENQNMLGILYMSTLFSNRAPQGGALLTIFMGGIKNPGITTLANDAIREIVKNGIIRLMRLPNFNPDLFLITRYNQAIPQYDISSGKRIGTISRLERQWPGLILGGNMRDGIGMSDRVRQGKMLSEQVTDRGKIP